VNPSRDRHPGCHPTVYNREWDRGPTIHRDISPVKQMRCEELRKRLIKLLQQELTLVFLARKLRIYI
ncbi:hypothetical protein ACGGYY_004790, partial [Salmonella enterica]